MTSRFTRTDGWILLALVALAAVPRFWDLAAVGLTHFDEGAYAMSAQAMAEGDLPDGRESGGEIGLADADHVAARGVGRLDVSIASGGVSRPRRAPPRRTHDSVCMEQVLVEEALQILEEVDVEIEIRRALVLLV